MLRQLKSKRKSKSTKKQRGQGMTEYIIIVALVAIGAIFVVTVFGDNIRALFGASANALQGESTSTSDLGGQEVGDEIKRDLKDFHELGEAP
jgi:Flp pilus assembly pilin Flp